MAAKEPKARKTIFRDSIIINVINTFILGGALVAITYIFNNKTERLKIEESFNSEYNKMRVQKIGESWGELNEWEARLDILMNQFIHYRALPSKYDSVLLGDMINQSAGYERLFKIERNRFWIGEKQYQKMGEFGLLVARKQDNILNYNQDSINILNKWIRQKRIEADSILLEMRNKN